ncbi:cyclase family protein [Aquisediminimonas profunda]|uniref:cyclase family protein n=1 Tax=Aquisediminimonas profunda TaxID=1550733 RepID=UPI001C62685B|nr:cyclase family protein [Aquisediminimonas profunda]
MARRFIDLSICIETDVASDPPPNRPQIKYWAHQDTFHQIGPFFPGLRQQDLPDHEGWAVEELQVNPHNGTHMDAPWHYHSTAGGKPAATIEQTPLEYCFQPGVKLDFRHFPNGYVATDKDVAQELKRIGHSLQPLDIVLVNTAAGARYGEPDYVETGCGMGREATLYLTERGVKVVGTDAWSWDAPFTYTAKKFAETGDASIIWEGHKAGKVRPYWQMEKLHNLESLPAAGFEVICFPVKIKGAGAGWTRAVAMFTD